jgi:negative regulator of sigma E activity
MKEEWAIKISMLIDGELSEQESSALIDQIQEDDALREIWVRYQVASSLIRSESNIIIPSDFSKQVSLSLESEPTVLAPTRQAPNYFNRATVGALAASLILFAVVVGNLPETVTSPSLSPVTLASHFQQSVAPASEKQLETAAQVAALEEEVWVQDEQLNDYLMKHSEKSRSTGAFAVLPFARVVSYGNGH